uniref:Transmembrane protein n=1 Tax=Glossina austeni TaxID=7395 RepID=A0A1A9VYT9_GLOAU
MNSRSQEVQRNSSSPLISEPEPGELLGDCFKVFDWFFDGIFHSQNASELKTRIGGRWMPSTLGKPVIFNNGKYLPTCKVAAAACSGVFEDIRRREIVMTHYFLNFAFVVVAAVAAVAVAVAVAAAVDPYQLKLSHSNCSDPNFSHSHLCRTFER